MTTRVNGIFRQTAFGRTTRRVVIEFDEQNRCQVKAESFSYSTHARTEMDSRELILILQKVAMDYTSFVLQAQASESKGVVISGEENHNNTNRQ